MDTQEFGYSTDGKRFYGRYRSRSLAEGEARGMGLEPLFTGMRQVDGESPLEIIPHPGSIQEVLDTAADEANVLLREAARKEGQAKRLKREAKAELRREARRFERLSKNKQRQEREAAEELHIAEEARLRAEAEPAPEPEPVVEEPVVEETPEPAPE